MTTLHRTTSTVTPTAVPAGYRIAELDDVADRAATIELDKWAFAFELTPEDDAVAVWELEPGRTVGVWDERDAGAPRLAAVHSSFAFTLPVPGGERLPTAGLTWVGVHPGHRRRGLARAMLTTHLARSIERGEVLSALYAAETGIYGRYGYGVATQHARLTVGRGAQLRDVPGADELVVELDRLDPARHGEAIQRVHTAVDRPGWIHRDTEALRAGHLLDWPSARRDAERVSVALVRTLDGEPRGYALFRRQGKWSDAGVPEGIVKLRESVALDAPAARALWGTLTDLDLMASVETAALPVDDALLHLLTDLRGAKVRILDDVWIRLLDVPAALSARRYQAPVDVVLEVRDELVPANAGRWHLRGGPEGATAEPTPDAADLVLDVADLASAYLGGTSLAALAAAGRVEERTPGRLAPTATAFGWPVAPVNSWGF
ncbi:GNAT family N-acetyltransferase [Georgenia subflava]|uniref:GNAT family N-acetyltransferase n=1 Tax=Georgenia subflava TaxID=1622177 RepID=A0A6N7EJG3_9MICO|nr:GNAT family N-acetyltransferase [Georgenia subflava]MPV38309.1 GNAT family N-acetyltransferase [Georgenia subflava]